MHGGTASGDKLLNKLLSMLLTQWHPINPVTNGPQKYDVTNRVAVLKGFFE